MKQYVDLIKFVRGSVWLHKPLNDDRKQGVQGGNRPVVVLSNNKFNIHSGLVNCIPMTTKAKDSPTHVNAMVEEQSQILCEQCKTIPQNELVKYYGQLCDEKIKEIERKILFQFGIQGLEIEHIQTEQNLGRIELSKEEVERLYVDEGKTGKECAEIFGITENYMRIYLFRNGIKKCKK